MQHLLAVVLSISAGSAGFAQAPNAAQSMPCRAIAAIVASKGAAVLRTGPSTFDGSLSGPGSRPLNQFAEPAWIRSANREQCVIGYRCLDTGLDNAQ